MTTLEAYRIEQLARSRQELAAARERFGAATTPKARKEAAADVEFWSNKSAYMANVRT